MQTDMFEVEGYGRVSVQHAAGWTGRAIVSWVDPVEKKNVDRKIPAQLILLLGRKAAKRSLKADLAGWIAALPDDVFKREEDSPATKEGDPIADSSKNPAATWSDEERRDQATRD